MAGRKPGGAKTGGRKAGTANKKTLEAQNIANRNKVDPFEILIWFAKGDWKKLGYKSDTVTKFIGDNMIEEPVISPELRHSAAGKAVEYLYPKRKAIEQTLSEEFITEIRRTIISKAV